MVRVLGRKCPVLLNLSGFYAPDDLTATLPGHPELHRLIGLEKGSTVSLASWRPEKKAIPWKHFGRLFLKGGKSLVIRLGVFD